MVGDDLGAYHAKATKKALRFDTTRFSEETRRQLTSFKSVGLGGKDARELSHVLNQMKQIYGSFQVTSGNLGDRFEHVYDYLLANNSIKLGVQ